MKQQISDCVLHYSNNCTKLLKDFAPEYYVVKKIVKVDYSPNRKTHRGGIYAKGPGFNLAGDSLLYFANQQKKYGVIHFMEYKSFEKDPIIGSAFTDDWESYVALTVGHEVSHAVQLYIEKMRKLERGAPHGDFFKKIYTMLRIELNRQLPDQKAAQKEFQDLLKSVRKIEYEL